MANEKRDPAMRPRASEPLTVVGLFAGIGGIELGLHAGRARDACSSARSTRPPSACSERALPGRPARRRRPRARPTPRVDARRGGLPVPGPEPGGPHRRASAGATRASSARSSGSFDAQPTPAWLLLENVPFMLQLDRGEAMRYLTDVARASSVPLGLPRRRRARVRAPAAAQARGAARLARPTTRARSCSPTTRASPTKPDADRTSPAASTGPRASAGSAGRSTPSRRSRAARRSASRRRPRSDCPTAASSLPDIRDAERLQGFDADWTLPPSDRPAQGVRWKLVGNAVSVPVAAGSASASLDADSYDASRVEPPERGALAGRRLGRRRAARSRRAVVDLARARAVPTSRRVPRVRRRRRSRSAPPPVSSTRARASSLRFPTGSSTTSQRISSACRRERVAA